MSCILNYKHYSRLFYVHTATLHNDRNVENLIFREKLTAKIIDVIINY